MGSETLSKVLYPNDGTDEGRRLRLKQQHFFVSCSLQDMIRSLDARGIPIEEFPDHWAVQLNDTHPSIAVAELMRLLLDDKHLDWDAAWTITTRSLAYTNHTLLPEALEKWGLDLFRLPAAAPPGADLRDQPPLPATGADQVPRRRGCCAGSRSLMKMALRPCGWPTWPPSPPTM